MLHLSRNHQLDLAGACRLLAGAPNLRELSLSQMELTRLPDELALLTQLRSLSVSYNRLVDIEVLRRLPELETLDTRSAGANWSDSDSDDLYQCWYDMHPRPE